MPEMIIPKYNIVLTYDITPEFEEAYYRFALGEFVPGMQGMGLYLARAWHTVYGDYPTRQSEFVAEDLATIREALGSEAFHKLEEQMLTYITNYEKKIVHFNQSFNIVFQD